MAYDDIKDPDAVLDWRWDWSQWLSDGESITVSTMLVSAGIVLDSSGFSPTSTTAWLSGGTQGTTYSVTNQVETSAGRKDNWTITIRVQQR